MIIRDYFNLGCKLFGVYCIFLSIPHFINAFASFYPIEGSGDDYEKIFFFYKITTRIVPIIYVVIGYQLIRNSEKIYAFSYKTSATDDFASDSDKFRFFLKLLGIYLITEYFPDLIKSISSYFTYTNAPQVWDLFTQKQFTTINFLPSIAAIVLWFYLLRSGDVFVKLGFQESAKNKNSEG